MKLVWEIDREDENKIKSFYNLNKQNPFVQQRIRRNVKKAADKVSKKIFWKAMSACLLTTQQRSGPDSAVTRFICANPFPLDLDICLKQKHLGRFVANTISAFGGLRRGNKIAEALSDNSEWLENGGWSEVFSLIRSLEKDRASELERKAARFISGNLKGFGPKQSRNLLQSLGLTRYEIPVDSRIIKWLNEFGFPVTLTAGALSDENYYSFVLDGIQKLCKQCGIYPCVLDAVIFSSFDQEWPEDKLVW